MNVPNAGEAVDRFFHRTPKDFLSLGARDFRQVTEMALRQRNIAAAAG